MNKQLAKKSLREDYIISLSITINAFGRLGRVFYKIRDYDMESYVLTSMKLNPDRIESAVRISWGPNIDPEVFAASIHELLSVAKEML